MRCQNFFINARLVIITIQVRRGRELDKIFIADFVFHQQPEMMIFVALDFFAFQPRAGRDIHFAADNRLDTFRPCSLIKLNDAVHCAVVGDGQRGKFQFVSPVHQLVQTARTIE